MNWLKVAWLYLRGYRWHTFKSVDAEGEIVFSRIMASRWVSVSRARWYAAATGLEGVAEHFPKAKPLQVGEVGQCPLDLANDCAKIDALGRDLNEVGIFHLSVTYNKARLAEPVKYHLKAFEFLLVVCRLLGLVTHLFWRVDPKSNAGEKGFKP